MTQFRIGEESYKKLNKRWPQTMLASFSAFAPIFFFIILIDPQSYTMRSRFWYWAFFLVLLAINTYRTVKKQKEYAKSFLLTISDKEITQEIMNMRPITIKVTQIKEVLKYKKGSYCVKGAGKWDRIWIPARIERPEELEKHLQALAPIKFDAKEPWHQKYYLTVSILTAGMMVALYLLDNKIIVGICGFILTGLIIYSIYIVINSKNMTVTSKRQVWIYFLILASVIYAMYTKLSGTPFSV